MTRLVNLLLAVAHDVGELSYARQCATEHLQGINMSSNAVKGTVKTWSGPCQVYELRGVLGRMHGHSAQPYMVKACM